jgi:DNA-binding protein Fis
LEDGIRGHRKGLNVNTEMKHLAYELYKSEISIDTAKKLLAKAMVDVAIEDAGGNQSAAARMLRIHRNSIIRIQQGKE